VKAPGWLFAAWLLAAALLVPAGCGGGGGGGETTHIRLVVADKNIRREGVECAGALPFHYIHAGASFRIEVANGDVVADGKLPAGRARNADPDIDWEVERIPTFCIVDIKVDLPAGSRYRLRLERGRPLEFAVKPRADGQPVVLVVQ
jgi:hypothetical protein